MIFVEHYMHVGGQYCCDIILSHMLAAIKHFVGCNFVFQQDSILANWVCTTVQLLHCKLIYP